MSTRSESQKMGKHWYCVCMGIAPAGTGGGSAGSGSAGTGTAGAGAAGSVGGGGSAGGAGAGNGSAGGAGGTGSAGVALSLSQSEQRRVAAALLRTVLVLALKTGAETYAQPTTKAEAAFFARWGLSPWGLSNALSATQHTLTSARLLRLLRQLPLQRGGFAHAAGEGEEPEEVTEGREGRRMRRDG
jgi:hypothetical protein